jgi:hypothetical protein
MSMAVATNLPWRRTFEQFLTSAAAEGQSVNCLWEEGLFDLLGVTEKITVPLTTPGIPHEIIGGLAVLIHVEASDAADGVMTADSDLLIRRCDLPRVIEIAEENGFSGSGDRLRHATFRATVHLHFTGEKSGDSQAVPHPEIGLARITLHGLDVPVMRLHDLVLTRLNSERAIDRVSVRSMDAAGLITADVEAALPEKLRSRLQNIRDTE